MDVLYRYSCSQEGALKEFWNWATGKPDPYIVDHKLKPDIYPYNGYYNRYGTYRLETNDIKKIKVILDYVEKTYLK